MRRHFRKIASCLLVTLTLLATGCHKNTLAYFDDTNAIPQGEIPVQLHQITIQPNDELLINVSSELPQETAIYNLPFNTPGLTSEIITNATTSQKQTYIVNREGDINFPVFGKIHVEGMTTGQLADMLEKRISADVESPLVRVELVNFRIKVMGEVLKPGSYTFDTERVSILDALAEAGDMTVYGKRDNVTVYREVDGKVVYQKLNLNDSRIISSPYYYLQQNDVVYVEPGSARSGQAEYNQNNSYKISVISTVASAISVITSLIIALVR